MTKIMKRAAASAVIFAIAAPAMATEWNASVWGKRREFTEHVEKIAELVSEKTGGSFTINVSYGGLSKPTENLDGISIGAFEMAQICAGYHEDKNPTLTAAELPFLGVRDLREEVAISNALYAHPAVKKDMERWNAQILMSSPMPQYNLVGRGDPRATVDSFNGMRVRATGGLGDAFKAVGAVPTSVASNEAYNAMESGVVDTVAFAPHAHLSFRTIDQANWWTENLNPGTVNCPVVVNIDAYNALSDEERAALDGSVDEAIDYYIETYGKLMDRWENVLTEKNIQKVDFSDEELAKFREATKGIQADWVAKMDAQGIPGEELLATIEKTLEEAHKTN
ncbi:C4-dicarboxylate ABC transporter substrate-binding protein [Oceanicola sp. 22II-s10i]|uniref:C4-dicarboxylate TRAP transporter substrate-binding protein n=1 Tax=Oceanicola sp. 22II-s10i TaxID=1317116 RepID=UPI000B521046|nr:C4-dicarboxylate TRAP transporter substrate-binding protein [Oceanicola sp. 22II-s10i]OWU82869.1 C4-dicarboxylate ABC transporter substrate-binding protein [Oceanicola sp. 22II-s10i]